MTSLLIVILTTRVACITRFDQWDIFNDFTFQNIPRNSSDVVAEILCVAGSLGRRMVVVMSALDVVVHSVPLVHHVPTFLISE